MILIDKSKTIGKVYLTFKISTELWYTDKPNGDRVTYLLGLYTHTVPRYKSKLYSMALFTMLFQIGIIDG